MTVCRTFALVQYASITLRITASSSRTLASSTGSQRSTTEVSKWVSLKIKLAPRTNVEKTYKQYETRQIKQKFMLFASNNQNHTTRFNWRERLLYLLLIDSSISINLFDLFTATILISHWTQQTSKTSNNRRNTKTTWPKPGHKMPIGE